MTRLMDIGLNVCRGTGRIPVVFAILLGSELRSLTGHKQWNGSEIDVLLLREQQVLFQSVSIGIKVNAFFVKVAPEQDDGVRCKTDGFGSPTKAPFAEGFRFVLCPKHSPVGQHEATNFGYSRSCLKEQPGHNFITLSGVLERQVLSSLEDISWEFGIIHDLGLPLVMF